MVQDNQLAPEFEDMPEEVYLELLARSRQVSAETALSVAEHRKIVRAERAERRAAGFSMGF